MTLLAQQMTYGMRAALCSNPTARRLFFLMEEKKTNLSINPDLNRAEDVLKIADAVGPHICILKTHVDILVDFSSDFITELQKIADRHNFLIFEDRKFADIGSVVKDQYSQGIYRIADWSHITNAHIVSGPGIIEGLQEVGKPLKRGLLLLAQMSSAGSMARGDYTCKAVELAEAYSDFVIGFICQGKISKNPAHIHFTPGCNLESKGDSLGQQFNTPDQLIRIKESDIVTVGRGVYLANDPEAKAIEYRNAAWKAYMERVN